MERRHYGKCAWSKAMQRKNTKKKKAEWHHCKMRALQRYDIDLNASIRKNIVEAIRGGRTTLLERPSKRVSIHRVKVENCPEMVVVYDCKRKELVTVLNEPKE